MLTLNPAIDLSQAVDQLLLFVLFSKDRGHFFLQWTDDVGMDLWKSQGEKFKVSITLDRAV